VVRRLLLILAFAVGLAGSSVLAGHSADASIPRRVSTRSEQVVRSVSATATVGLNRPATSVAAYWQGSADAQVTLAFSFDGVTFGTPRSAGRDEMGEQRKNGTTYGALLSAPGAVALRVNTDRPLARLTVLGLSDAVTTAAVTTAAEPAPSLTLAAAVATTSEPSIVSRAGWQADPAYMTWAPQFYPTKKLVVHHTATSDNYTDRAGAEGQIRSIYYYHSVTQDWGDIGYNFLIDKFGTIYEGRYSRDHTGANPTGDDPTGQGVTGAHTAGWNSGTVGVALLGTLTTHDATPAARDALTRLLAWKRAATASTRKPPRPSSTRSAARRSPARTSPATATTSPQPALATPSIRPCPRSGGTRP
jgi:hypothetical protein